MARGFSPETEGKGRRLLGKMKNQLREEVRNRREAEAKRRVLEGAQIEYISKSRQLLAMPPSQTPVPSRLTSQLIQQCRQRILKKGRVLQAPPGPPARIVVSSVARQEGLDEPRNGESRASTPPDQDQDQSDMHSKKEVSLEVGESMREKPQPTAFSPPLSQEEPKVFMSIKAPTATSRQLAFSRYAPDPSEKKLVIHYNYASKEEEGYRPNQSFPQRAASSSEFSTGSPHRRPLTSKIMGRYGSPPTPYYEPGVAERALTETFSQGSLGGGGGSDLSE